MEWSVDVEKLDSINGDRRQDRRYRIHLDLKVEADSPPACVGYRHRQHRRFIERRASCSIQAVNCPWA
ncbi:MAG: hypothetical protein WDO73_06755 [Ignavibacteriota bacterium]